MTETPINSTPSERLVISYMGDNHYHREHPGDMGRPDCDAKRIRGVLAIRREAERGGQKPCPRCWPVES